MKPKQVRKQVAAALPRIDLKGASIETFVGSRMCPKSGVVISGRRAVVTTRDGRVFQVPLTSK